MKKAFLFMYFSTKNLLEKKQKTVVKIVKLFIYYNNLETKQRNRC